MRLLPLCLILPALALAACNASSSREAEQASAAAAHAQNAADAAAAAAAAAAPQTTPDRLSSFVLATGGAQLNFRRTGPTTWEGPSPDNGQVVQWSQEDADSASLVLYTETPRIRTMTVYDDDTASCSCFSGGSAVVTGASYQ